MIPEEYLPLHQALMDGIQALATALNRPILFQVLGEEPPAPVEPWGPPGDGHYVCLLCLLGAEHPC